MTRKRSASAAAGALLGALLLGVPGAAPAFASSASGLYISGAGFGHGIGMSQYGAAGYAVHGAGYRQILRDYYAQTAIAGVSPNRPVTVLLKPRGAAAFSGATTIRGARRRLNAHTDYSVLVVNGRLRIVAGGRTIGTFDPPLQVSGPAQLQLVGHGAYRGSFVFRPSASGNGVMTVNSVGLDDYVRGVVAAEMPAGWPQQALDAQAVAARTYAITAGAIGGYFDVYDDTRSQMYEGVSAETPATDAAVAATRGQVVEYDGAPAVTYFFASSGGQTESIQNVWAGVTPQAWLVAKSDPYDNSFNNPYHRWNLKLGLGAARTKLGRLVDGSLQGIRVLQRGVSPRVVQAQVVGSRGSRTVTGAQLQADLGTPSTWMSFTTVSAHGVQTTVPVATPTPPPTPAPAPTPPPTSTATTPATTTTTTPTTTTSTTSGGVPLGGGGQGALVRGRAAGSLGSPDGRYAVDGTVYPADGGARVSVQLDLGRAWATVATGTLSSDGSYSVAVPGRGTYRVLYGGIVGPTITVG